MEGSDFCTLTLTYPWTIPSGFCKPLTISTGPYKALNKAFDLADHIGVTPTIQTAKTLEECITQQYMDSPWSKSTYHLSDDEGSDIVDMSDIPAGHEGQDEDWDCQFEAVSPCDEPLHQENSVLLIHA